MPPYGCRRRNLTWDCWIILSTMRQGCVRVNFVVWGHRRKVSTLCLLYKIYHRVGHPINVHLNYFVAARNTRASAALDELALVNPRCRTDKFSQSFLPAAGRLWDLLPSGVFSSDILSSFKSAMNMCAY